MPNAKNTAQVSDLKEKLQQAQSVVVADYSGMNVGSQNDLRSKVSEVGGEFIVAKNRLFKIAVSPQLVSGQETLEQALSGPNAFVFSYSDAIAAIKAVFDFAKTNEALEIKLGILDGKVLDYTTTENLSKLPSKNELIGQLISRIQAPMYGLVSVINGPTRGLVYALKAIQDKKSTTDSN